MAETRLAGHEALTPGQQQGGESMSNFTWRRSVRRVVAVVVISGALASCGVTTTRELSPQATLSPQAGKAIVVLATRVPEPGIYYTPVLRFVPFDKEAGALFESKSDAIGEAFTVSTKLDKVDKDHRPDWQYHVLVVSPGTYILHSTGWPKPSTAYNFGTIAFDVNGGDVLYLGNYSFHTGTSDDPPRKVTTGDVLKTMIPFATSPDPEPLEVYLMRDDAGVREAMEAFPGIKEAPRYFNYETGVTFKPGRVEMMYQVKFGLPSYLKAQDGSPK
jgi:hypothetical protein